MGYIILGTWQSISIRPTFLFALPITIGLSNCVECTLSFAPAIRTSHNLQLANDFPGPYGHAQYVHCAHGIALELPDHIFGADEPTFDHRSHNEPVEESVEDADYSPQWITLGTSRHPQSIVRPY